MPDQVKWLYELPGYFHRSFKSSCHFSSDVFKLCVFLGVLMCVCSLCVCAVCVFVQSVCVCVCMVSAYVVCVQCVCAHYVCAVCVYCVVQFLHLCSVHMYVCIEHMCAVFVCSVCMCICSVYRVCVQCICAVYAVCVHVCLNTVCLYVCLYTVCSVYVQCMFVVSVYMYTCVQYMYTLCVCVLHVYHNVLVIEYLKLHNHWVHIHFVFYLICTFTIALNSGIIKLNFCRLVDLF